MARSTISTVGQGLNSLSQGLEVQACAFEALGEPSGPCSSGYFPREMGLFPQIGVDPISKRRTHLLGLVQAVLAVLEVLQALLLGLVRALKSATSSKNFGPAPNIR